MTPVSLMLDAATMEPPSPGTPVRAPGSPGAAGFQAPRPFRSASLVLAVALLTAALWAGGLVPAVAALALGIPVIALGVGKACLDAYDLRRSRLLGDALLRAHVGQPPLSGLAAWRSDELTSPSHRRRLARRIRELRREIEACVSLGSPHLGEDVLTMVRRLEWRLDAVSGPVSALGIIEVEATVSADLSPLFYPERAGDLPSALDRALDGLGPEHRRPE